MKKNLSVNFFLIKSSETYAKKCSSKLEQTKLCQGGFSLLNPPLRGGLGPPRTPPGPALPDHECFWIELLQPTGYRVSVVRVSESGSRKFPIPQFTTNVEYKIDHISKTKNYTKKVIHAKKGSTRSIPIPFQFQFRSIPTL